MKLFVKKYNPILVRVLYILLLFLFQNGFSQTYPITASFQIIPPYNVYLPDYCVPGSDKIRVILLQNDLTVPSYDVRLRMTIEWNGSVIMRTSPNFIPPPITLSAGVPNLVSGNDLCIYFDTNAIDFSGYSRENYERTKVLPEGAYRISFTAYDYRRQNVQVSNVGSNIFFLQKKNPPLLNTPFCNTRIPKQDPQFITFNWSSVNTPSLPGNETEYTFSLFEIKPKNSDPNFIVRSSLPIYTTVTQSNTLPYGLGEPPLLDSMEYVWIVQARSSDGRDLYSNQGYSIPCKFTYGGADPFADNQLPRPTVFAEPVHERAAKVWWPLARRKNIVESYQIEYRGSTNSLGEFPWHAEERENDSTLTLSPLEPEREYEVRIRWKVRGIYGTYSEVVKFTTPKPQVLECGKNTASSAPANQAPLLSANAGITVKIGSLDITLLEVSGGNGTYSGKGKIANNGFLHGLRMNFSNIYINSDLIVTRGEMHADAEPIEAYVGKKLERQHKVDTYKKFANKIPNDSTSLSELKEFAKALIEIPQDRIDNAIALKREEKQQIETAREKAKESLKTLNDPKASAEEKQEAEKNLRKAVADAKPALDKLANTLDRGIQTVVGRWFKNIMDFLSRYKGNSDDEKRQAEIWHHRMDSTVEVLSKKTNVPDSLMNAMLVAHQNAKTAWLNLEKGSDGKKRKGPGNDFDDGFTAEDIALCKKEVAAAEKVAEINLPKPKGTYTVYVDDSIMTDKKVFIKTSKQNKLYIKYEPAAGDTVKTTSTRMVCSSIWSEKDISWPATTWNIIKVNTKTSFGLDSLPAGKYKVLLKNRDNSVDTLRFSLQNKKHDFACSVCGRDLSITLDKLNLIFPGNMDIIQTHADYFNDALKKGGFTTCKRHAHFFSQVAIESKKFTQFEENHRYRLCGFNSQNKEIGIYATFGTQDNDSYKTLYHQNFWDKNEHLDYTGVSSCAHLYHKEKDTADIKNKTKRYIGVDSITKTRNKYSVTFPKNFKKDTTGTYIKYSITDSKKCGENLFNLVYKGKNGNTENGDGWRYRGRGAIQVTGRANYRNVSKKAREEFSKSYNWEDNPDELMNNKDNPDAVIYSAVAWFLNAFNPISTLDHKTSNEVTRKVNAKQLDKEGREKKYNELINENQLYNCEKK